MHPLLSRDLKRLPELLEQARNYAVSVLADLPSRPAAVPPAPKDAEPLPEEGIGSAAALEHFQRRWATGFSGSAGSRYLGFVTGGATPAAVVGDWLTGVFDQNVVSSSDSCATDLERETVGWLRELFGLSAEHSGAFVTGATMSNFVGLAIGREWVGEQLGVSIADDGLAAVGDIPVLSSSPHSSTFKALSMLGIGRNSVRRIPSLPGREAVDVDQLAAELEVLDGRPAIVVANAGTVNTVDFDDLRALAELRQRHRFWLHVDAAFGGFAALSPRYADLVAGLDQADSICIDLHKWLNVPYDSGVQFSRRPDLQVRIFQNYATYLGLPGPDPDFVHLTPESSRRLRALPAWFTLTAYGRQGHREIVERDAALAQELGNRISAAPHLRLLAPVRLNTVCFTLAEQPTAEKIDALANAIARSGQTFLSPTVHQGVPALRAAVSNWRTTEDDLPKIMDALGCPAA